MSDQPTELDQLFREAPSEEHEGEEEEAPRKRRRSSATDHGVTGLNLTAMMDMMTILLVFLLKNYASTAENVQLTDTLQPPRSTSHVMMEPATTVTMTKTAILLDDKPVAGIDLANAKVIVNDPDQVEGDMVIAPLSNLLQEQVANMQTFEKKGLGKFEGKILIVADEKIPYSILMRVLVTAGNAHFSQYKLVVRSSSPAGKAAGGGE